VEALAREIAGTDANAEIQEPARRVAEAQIDLRRLRYARHQVLSHALSEPYYQSRADTRKQVRHRRPSAMQRAGYGGLGGFRDVDAGRAAEIGINPLARGETVNGDGPV
jgi:hypothetical protein